MKTKKGVYGLEGLFNAVIMVIMVAVVVGLGTIVLSDMGKVSSATNSSSYGYSNFTLNVLNNGSTAISTINTTWISIIVLVVVVGLLIAILLSAFAFKGRQ